MTRKGFPRWHSNTGELWRNSGETQTSRWTRLGCGDEGEGKLQDIETIAALTESFTLKDQNKKLLLTTGATLAPLDSVRYLTNASTGQTAVPFIKESLARGIRTALYKWPFLTTRQLKIICSWNYQNLSKFFF